MRRKGAFTAGGKGMPEQRYLSVGTKKKEGKEGYKLGFGGKGLCEDVLRHQKKETAEFVFAKKEDG